MRNRKIFWVLIVLGVLGLIDFLSRGFITPIFNQTFGLNLGSIGLVAALLFDSFKGSPALAGTLTVAATFLGDAWWLFMLMAYALRRSMKKSVNPSA